MKTYFSFNVDTIGFYNVLGIISELSIVYNGTTKLLRHHFNYLYTANRRYVFKEHMFLPFQIKLNLFIHTLNTIINFPWQKLYDSILKILIF